MVYAPTLGSVSSRRLGSQSSKLTYLCGLKEWLPPPLLEQGQEAGVPSLAGDTTFGVRGGVGGWHAWSSTLMWQRLLS